MDELGLYVHVPFCTTKCGYCDFYSVAGPRQDMGRLVRCIERELSVRGGDLDIGPDTVFFGGGTPTLLGDAELTRLLEAVGHWIRPRRLREFTVEANPATLHPQNCDRLLAAGVDRVSIGAQSFEPDELATLERIHHPADIPEAVRIARQAGFSRLSLDLIFGVPGQTLKAWLRNLRRAVELAPDHLSCYGLTYEPATALTARRDRGLIEPCTEELEAEMYLACIDALATAGFEHYEISNFARPGQRCQHNVNTWRSKSYVGVGPSAASYINGQRQRNVPHLETYVQMIETGGTAAVESERLNELERAGEWAMLGLRLIEGFTVKEFRRQTGHNPLELFGETIRTLQGLGLLAEFEPGIPDDDRRIRLTRKGLLVADRVMAEFLHPAVRQVRPA